MTDIRVEKTTDEWQTSWDIYTPTMSRVVRVRLDHRTREVTLNWSGCGDRSIGVSEEFLMALVRGVGIAMEAGQ